MSSFDEELEGVGDRLQPAARPDPVRARCGSACRRGSSARSTKVEREQEDHSRITTILTAARQEGNQRVRHEPSERQGPGPGTGDRGKATGPVPVRSPRARGPTTPAISAMPRATCRSRRARCRGCRSPRSCRRPGGPRTSSGSACRLMKQAGRTCSRYGLSLPSETDVEAELALGALDREVDLALGRLDHLGHLGHHRPVGQLSPGTAGRCAPTAASPPCARGSGRRCRRWCRSGSRTPPRRSGRRGTPCGCPTSRRSRAAAGRSAPTRSASAAEITPTPIVRSFQIRLLVSRRSQSAMLAPAAGRRRRGSARSSPSGRSNGWPPTRMQLSVSRAPQYSS